MAWLDANQPELADPLGDDEIAVLEQGQKIGVLARDLYPGGILIQHEERSHADAVRDTLAALANPDVSVIYEAAFRAGPDDVRADILLRAPNDQFDLVEVKSASEIRNKELDDVAYQLHLIENAGYSIRRVLIAHPNRAYRRGNGPIDVHEFFLQEDVTEAARERVPVLAQEQANLRLVVSQPQPPQVGIGPHCNKPIKCRYQGICHRTIGDDHIENIAHISDKLRKKLREAGIISMRDIPADWELSPQQRRWVDMVKRGTPILDLDGLASDLANLRFPIHSFDFETVQSIIPLWPGRRVYESVVFQFSNHTLDASGTVTHTDYLHADFDDPEEAVFHSMQQALGAEGSILIYSQFEVQQWRDMARRRPDWEPYLRDLEKRAIDFLPIVRRNFAHPALRGRYSLKALYKQLLPGFSYDDLVIRNGAQAAAAYAEILDPNTTSTRRSELVSHLRAYCSRDTWALLLLLLRLHPQLGQQVQANTLLSQPQPIRQR